MDRMKKHLTAFGILPLILGCTTGPEPAVQPPFAQPDLAAGPTITADGLQFRDLNRNGTLEPYEDWRLSPDMRAADLVSRLTLEEKVGAVMHGTAPAIDGSFGGGTQYDLDAAREIILGRHVTTMVTRLDNDPAEFARQNNLLQDIAAEGRLGIPVAISSDPRNHFQFTPGASVAAKGFTKWPEATGFGAIDDPDLTRRFGEIMAGEFRATGISILLGPMADIASEPRWPRVNGTFGEDPDVVADQAAALITGAQGGTEGPNPGHVVSVVKHWAGYGAAADRGYDSHNSYGRYASLTLETLAMHMHAFDKAFAVHVAGVMPTYSILRDASFDGMPVEQVGAGYSHVLLGDALRKAHGFDGFVLSDFAVTDDCNDACFNGAKKGEPFGVSMAWGVEDLAKPDRFALGMNAGLDQYGGTEEVTPLIAAMHKGLVSEARLDAATRANFAPLFAIGLFEQPYVDPEQAATILASPGHWALARQTQSRAMVPLKVPAGLLPLKPGTRVFLDAVSVEEAKASGLVPVNDPALADVAIVRIHAPFKPEHPGYLFGSFQHEGDLDFKPGDEQLERVRSLARKLPTVTAVYLDRPAVLTAIASLSTGLFAEFGASDAAILDVLTGAEEAQGKMPFELPSSMEAVRNQRPDIPHDSKAPLFPLGFRQQHQQN